MLLAILICLLCLAGVFACWHGSRTDKGFSSFITFLAGVVFALLAAWPSSALSPRAISCGSKTMKSIGC